MLIHVPLPYNPPTPTLLHRYYSYYINEISFYRLISYNSFAQTCYVLDCFSSS